MRLQQSDPIFTIGPAFNLESKYTVTMLTRDEWTRGPVIPLVKGLVWFTDGCRMNERNEAGICGQFLGKGFIISVGKN